MIETLGLPALIAAADAAAKAAEVKIVTYQGADAGIVAVYLIGDVASVRAAVAVGESAAKRAGRFLHSNVIPRPDQSVPDMIYPSVESVRAKQLAQLTVPQLRKLARTYDQFPLSPQEISLARKEELIRHLLRMPGKEGDRRHEAR
jgi:microcompartment protein CcmL/EutN